MGEGGVGHVQGGVCAEWLDQQIWGEQEEDVKEEEGGGKGREGMEGYG